MIKKISIIGGGEIGGAISYIATHAGISYSVWDKNPTKSSTSSPEECLRGADVVFFCLPSSVLRASLAELSLVLPPAISLVFVSKGLEKETGFTAPEIAAEFVEQERIIFMGGPMIAEEIIAGKGGCAVLGGTTEATSHIIKIFENGGIHIEIEQNAFSVAILGVLKNIYAIAIGATEGAGKGDNIKAYLFAKSVHEMDIASRALGGKVNVMSSAGIGDFLATSVSSGSSNRRAGFDVVSGVLPTKISEGMDSVGTLMARLDANALSNKLNMLPIISFVRDIVINKSVSLEYWDKILK